MSASTSVRNLVTVVKAFHFGGSHTKIRKRYVIQIADATNGITVGGETNKFNVADLGLGLSFVDNCSSLLVFTTSTKATAKIIPAVPSADLSRISTADAANATAANHEGPADAAISTSQTGQITIEGY